MEFQNEKHMKEYACVQASLNNNYEDDIPFLCFIISVYRTNAEINIDFDRMIIQVDLAHSSFKEIPIKCTIHSNS